MSGWNCHSPRSIPTLSLGTTVMVSLIALFFLGTTAIWLTSTPSSNAMTLPHSSLPTAATKHVFCFGDSLTAGTSPPSHQKFPYAPHMEEALMGELLPANSQGVKVEWKGFPGWTAPLLLTDAGFSGMLDRAREERKEETPGAPPFDLVVILAGTNDLAYATESKSVVESIRGIHELATSRGCSTIALGIPPSGWQTHSETARNLASAINQELASWAATTTTTTYVPFPIQTFDRDSGLWSRDGLHFSETGYQYFGKSLAPFVAKILWQDN